MTAVAARRGRSLLFWAAIVGGLALAALLLGPPAAEGDPLDPRSTGRFGARGLVLLLEELGGDVVVSDRVPADGADVAVVLVDRLSEEQRDALAVWASRGGVLVVADPASPLHPRPPAGTIGSGLFDDGLRRGSCDLPPLAAVERLDVGDGVRFPLAAGSTGCFGDPGSGEAAIVAAPEGRGAMVSIGVPSMFANERLANDDNAVAAAALLVPRPGTAVVVLEAAAPGGGEDTLADLIPRRVNLALLQLVVAFGLLALWRSRRLGRPVREPQPVQIEGSELVVAVGNLLQRTKDPDRSGALLRRDLHRRMAQRVGLPADAAADTVADVAASRSGAEREAILAVLAGPAVRNETELLALARQIDAIAQEVLHGR